MTSILKNKLRLKPSILTLFVILTVPVFVTIVSATYLSNDKQARANARELIERFRVDAIENIQSVFDPIKSLAAPGTQLFVHAINTPIAGLPRSGGDAGLANRPLRGVESRMP